MAICAVIWRTTCCARPLIGDDEAPKTIRPQALAAEALGRMNQQAITSLFAVDDESRPLGIVRIHDCLRAGIA